MTTAKTDVATGLWVTPIPNSSHVSPHSMTKAGHTERSQRGTLRFRVEDEESSPHIRRRTNSVARVFHGQMPHHAVPATRTEITTTVHQIVQVRKVAILAPGT